DFKRALTINDRYGGLTVNVPKMPFWLTGGEALVYRRTSHGEQQFMQVDAATGFKRPAFDQARLAAALNKVSHESYQAGNLPFDRFELSEDGRRLDFQIEDTRWSCDLASYDCTSTTFDARKGDPRELSHRYTPPWYDISNIGIFGASAGGQSAVSALLFHPDFYKVAVAKNGCYDNRIDKTWWNELWMGWPVGIEYSQSSAVDNAHRLQGKLMIAVGEMDDNVDPFCSFQLADRLIKAGKDFDMVYVPGANHHTLGTYTERKLLDFFVRNILGQTPPDWNTKPIELE
ncbi:MAG: hypothetical protein E5V24_16405, partial [Mesorhizobium sp.]